MFISKCTKFMHLAVEIPFFFGWGRKPPDTPTGFGLGPKSYKTPLMRAEKREVFGSKILL